MKFRRLVPLARGVGSFAILVGLMVGPPIALAWFVGWPLPTSLPDFPTLEAATRSGVSDQVVVNALAIFGWLAWVQVALSIVIEIAAVIRHRPARELPLLPGLQHTIGRMIASVLMMAASAHPAVASATPPMPVVVMALPAMELPHVVDVRDSVAKASVTESNPTRRPTCCVREHDSYWAIAERTVGDGLRWQEIRDLNTGRVMSDGHLLEGADETLRPGWTLQLPDDAHGDEETPPAEPPPPVISDPPPTGPVPLPPTGEVEVQAGDNFWDLAEQQLSPALGRQPTDLEVLPYWQDLIDANMDRLVQPGDPSLILPGQALVLPPIPGTEASPGMVGSTPAIDLQPDPQSGDEAEAAPTVPAPPTPPDATVIEADAGQRSPQQDVVAPDPPESPGQTPNSVVDVSPATEPTISATPVPASLSVQAPSTAPPALDALLSADDPTNVGAALGSGIASIALAVGATRMIRLRRRQRAHLGVEVAPDTPDETQQVHRALLAAADEAHVGDLATILADLSRGLANAGADCRPRIVQHGPSGTEVLFDHPAPQPLDGWTAEGDGIAWVLARPTGIAEAAATASVAPLLVTLGQPDESRQLYIDLEAEGIVSLTGDSEAARAIATSMISELAVSPFGESVDIVAVGELDTPALTGLGRITIAASWDDVEQHVTAWSEQTHRTIAEHAWRNAFLGRIADPHHEALAAVAVFASEPPSDEVLDIILARQPSTVALVLVSPADSVGTDINCTAERLAIDDLGLGCVPKPITHEQVGALATLVATPDLNAERPAEAALSVTRCAVRGANDEPEYDILVRLLGDIRVEGGAPLRPKQTAVLAYIALHRSVATERLQDACWSSPTTNDRRKRLANTISACRRAIGGHHLPVAAEGRYIAGPKLLTDTALFDLRASQANHQTPEDAALTLMSALELATGPVFTYRSADRDSFAWIDVENLVVVWEARVAGAAQQCADLLLLVGRTDDATRVSLDGLNISPTHPGLTESLMRAYGAKGDLNSVRRTFQAHVGAIEKLGLDRVAESTATIYEDLCSGTITGTSPLLITGRRHL